MSLFFCQFCEFFWKTWEFSCDKVIFSPKMNFSEQLFYRTPRNHSFSTYAEFSEKLTFLTPWLRTSACAYQEVRNDSFSENFAYVLNECPSTILIFWIFHRVLNHLICSDTSLSFHSILNIIIYTSVNLTKKWVFS